MTIPARRPPAQAIVEAAMQACDLCGDGHAARRHDAAQAILKLPEPTVTELGPSRASIARAIRAGVVALAMARTESAQRAIAYSTRKLCDALLSEPMPTPGRIWWADHD